jgi:hypothetical protein
MTSAEDFVANRIAGLRFLACEWVAKKRGKKEGQERRKRR